MKYFLWIFAVATVFYSCKPKSYNGITATQYIDTLYSIQSAMIMQVDSFFQAVNFDKYNAEALYQKALAKQAASVKQLQQFGTFGKEDAPYLATQQICEAMGIVLQNSGRTLLQWRTIVMNEYNEPLQHRIDSLLTNSILKITQTQVHYDTVAVQFLSERGFDVKRER
jgi:hypothetical protein